jgi:glycosyltransferase involved in cell wall biosynthesis
MSTIEGVQGSRLADRAGAPAAGAPASSTLVSSHDVALVHDYLLVLRGAERTFAAIADMWPSAPIYTLLYDPQAMKSRFATHRVETSILQRARIDQRGFRKLLPLFPLMAERLPVKDHQVIVSSSSAFAHGVRPADAAVHVCYCHTPFRYAWWERERALAEVAPALRPLLAAALAAIRRWDLKASRRVTRYVAVSRLTQRRILELYGLHANIVHPPVEVDRFRRGDPEDYFLTVTELVPHKQVDVAAEAAVTAGKRLKVVGGGPELESLRARYSPQVEFLGRVSDEELEQLYAGALAVIVPNVEEFGIVAVEGQAAGRPVIAARAGGAIETVLDTVTGCFVEPGDVRDLVRVLRSFRPEDYDAEVIQLHARKFSPASFHARLGEEIEAAIDESRVAA